MLTLSITMLLILFANFFKLDLKIFITIHSLYYVQYMKLISIQSLQCNNH